MQVVFKDIWKVIAVYKLYSLKIQINNYWPIPRIDSAFLLNEYPSLYTNANQNHRK